MIGFGRLVTFGQSLVTKPLFLSTSNVLRQQLRYFSIPTPNLSDAAKAALGKISSATKKKKPKLTKKDFKTFPGNLRNYFMYGGKPEFHNIDRNKNGHIYESSDKFRVVITASVRNVYMVVQNKSRNFRTVFKSWCGNVGIRGLDKSSPQAPRRVAANIAKKLYRLGVNHVEVAFRRTYRIQDCLDSFQTNGLILTSIVHQPRICKGPMPKPRKRRVV
eukprot:GDKJ01014207.1.p1 GENE.GDKJ01014207.1~~GDKJ01014207.1.p1  ORF type:complete len:218 (-),score=15.41 GDKJ01014207.1:56-709(-)